jgi:hypothetical protein
MRRHASTRAAVRSALKILCSRVPRGSWSLKATVGSPQCGARGVAPGVVFGRGARERTAQEPGRVSFLLETIRQIYGAPVTNPPCTVGVCEVHIRRGQEQAPASR